MDRDIIWEGFSQDGVPSTGGLLGLGCRIPSRLARSFPITTCIRSGGLLRFHPNLRSMFKRHAASAGPQIVVMYRDLSWKYTTHRQECSCKFDTDPSSNAHLLSPYAYVPLTSSTSTRVFEISPALPDEPIQGRLIEVELGGQLDEYYALSYTWGSRSTPHPIECSGCVLFVTCNLHSALLRLRQSTEPSRFFIDAISINQAQEATALKERADQVRLMGRIFGGAATVMVDLGDAADNSDEALQLLSSFNSIPDNVWKLFDSRPMDSGQEMVRFASNYDIPPFAADQWTALTCLSTRKWFERVWCIQEFVLAKSCLILVGNAVLQAETFLSTLIGASKWPGFAFSGGWVDPREDSNRTHCARKLKNASKCANYLLLLRQQSGSSGQEEPHLALANLLASTRRYKATDWRDKVYALFGMMDPDQVDHIEIRYDEPVHSLSARISRFLLNHGQLRILLHQLAAYNKSPVSSWMVDLTSDQQPEGIDLYHDFQHFTPENEGDYRLSENGDILYLRGSVLGELNYVSDTFPESSKQEDYDENEDDLGILTLYRTLHWQLRTFAAMVSKLNPFDSLPGEDPDTIILHIFHAFLLTTSAGGVYSTFPTRFTPEHFQAYIRYLTFQRPAANWQDFFTASITDGFDDIKPVPANQLPLSAESHRLVLEVSTISTTCCMGRKLALMDSRRMTLVPGDAHSGDFVAILSGVDAPFVVRKNGDYWRLVGTAHVHGIKQGQYLNEQGVGVEDLALQ